MSSIGSAVTSEQARLRF